MLLNVDYNVDRVGDAETKLKPRAYIIIQLLRRTLGSTRGSSRVWRELQPAITMLEMWNLRSFVATVSGAKIGRCRRVNSESFRPANHFTGKTCYIDPPILCLYCTIPRTHYAPSSSTLQGTFSHFRPGLVRERGALHRTI